MENDELITIKDAEKYVIKKALIKAKGSRKIAANILQIGERTLYSKIHNYDININKYNYFCCK